MTTDTIHSTVSNWATSRGYSFKAIITAQTDPFFRDPRDLNRGLVPGVVLDVQEPFGDEPDLHLYAWVPESGRDGRYSILGEDSPEYSINVLPAIESEAALPEMLSSLVDL